MNQTKNYQFRLEPREILHVSFGLILVIISSSLVNSSASTFAIINFTGTINASNENYRVVNAQINLGQTITENNLSLGTHVLYELPYLAYNTHYTSLGLQQKFESVNFKFVRFFIHEVQPCTFWNDTFRTGTYDWSRFDNFMSFLQSANVQVLLVIGFGGWGNTPATLPTGMVPNYNNTYFPNPDSFAAYVGEIATHIQVKGFPVKYWEIWNEPQQALIEVDNKYPDFVNLFNMATDKIVQISPGSLCGVDLSNYKQFLDRFVYDGRNVGFLSFHQYDSWSLEGSDYYSNSQVLNLASNPKYPWSYAPHEMENKWFSVRGYSIPIICSETNLNAAWSQGTDPRMQELIGAVWYADELRTFILDNVSYSVYFQFASANPFFGNFYGVTSPIGNGFGMVNMTQPNEEWYPFETNFIFGNNLEVGDKICGSSTSNDTEVSILSWETANSYDILLIGKTVTPINVNLNFTDSGIENATKISGYLIDKNQMLQTLEMRYSDSMTIYLSGYSVLLLKIPLNS